MSDALARLRNVLGRYLRGRRGGSAVEMALGALLLTIPLLNVADLAFYAYRKMQVENAAQVGAQAAWAACNTVSKWPATDPARCPELASAISNAITSTSLGGGVVQMAGSPTEGFYCQTTAGDLQMVGTQGTVGVRPTKVPTDCSGVTKASNPTAPPGDYIQVRVAFVYKPIFRNVSLVSLLKTPITKTTWVRLV